MHKYNAVHNLLHVHKRYMKNASYYTYYYYFLFIIYYYLFNLIPQIVYNFQVVDPDRQFICKKSKFSCILLR